MKPLSQARIGYAAIRTDFSPPGDRRRFSAYARQRGLRYEYARIDEDYDVVIVTQTADLAGWAARKQRQGDRFRLVLDLVDGYFEQKRLDERLLKGVGRYFEGTDTRLSPDFRRTLKNVCRAADAIWCSTPEQRATILQYNDNVQVSFDWFDEELAPPKEDFRREGSLKLIWEGQAGTLRSIQTIRETLNALKDKVELHVVTDPSTPRWYGRIGKRPVSEILAGIECPMTIYPWDKATFSQQITSADLALIPMDLNATMFKAKPENKLVLLWKLGMPVLVGPTRAYRRTMDAAGLDMLCETQDDWARQLTELSLAPPERLRELGKRGYDYAMRAYNIEAFRAPFDAVFNSLGFEV